MSRYNLLFYLFFVPNEIFTVLYINIEIFNIVHKEKYISMERRGVKDNEKRGRRE